MPTSAEAKKYHRIKNRLFIINLAFSLLILLAVILSGFSLGLKFNLNKLTSGLIWLNGLYIISFSVIFYILSFPLEFYEGFILEHKFKLSNETVSGYLKDNLKKAGISLLIALIAIEGLYWFLGGFRQIWWILAAIGWFFLTVILARITPNILIPLFYKYIPLKDEELRIKIRQMFAAAGVPLKDVYMINFSAKTSET